ncbi:GNAT family N-acetyltransferase [Pontibacillus litoralis]|uniref:GCN5 family acetyltransferase n=1 Tax=Pontibacillus litoralis JSM 072002 TaxID=1385512 RepID=A0A0A5G4V8_9BACI|nr:GNAT family protein [Pontibacillus litoralis]KGX88156.1 GCN5 family acetyltransferase [Pontibacillus litoralis JSM 072002]
MFTYTINESTSLRLLQLRDAEAVFNLIDHNRSHLRTWLPWVDSTANITHTTAFIESTLNKFGNSDGFDAGIWYEGQLAGVIGLHYIDYNNRKTSIGYWLGESFQGKGIITEAAQALTNYALETLNLNRVEIRCATENAKSEAIPKRIGFTKEGTIQQAERLYDRYVDHHIYAMIQEKRRL